MFLYILIVCKNVTKRISLRCHKKFMLEWTLGIFQVRRPRPLSQRPQSSKVDTRSPKSSASNLHICSLPILPYSLLCFASFLAFLVKITFQKKNVIREKKILVPWFLQFGITVFVASRAVNFKSVIISKDEEEKPQDHLKVFPWLSWKNHFPEITSTYTFLRARCICRAESKGLGCSYSSWRYPPPASPSMAARISARTMRTVPPQTQWLRKTCCSPPSPKWYQVWKRPEAKKCSFTLWFPPWLYSFPWRPSPKGWHTLSLNSRTWVSSKRTGGGTAIYWALLPGVLLFQPSNYPWGNSCYPH